MRQEEIWTNNRKKKIIVELESFSAHWFVGYASIQGLIIENVITQKETADINFVVANTKVISIIFVSMGKLKV